MGIFKKLVLFLLVFGLSTTALTSYAITPLRVAVMPPINTADFRYIDDVQVMQDTIKKPFKYPYYTLIPADIAAKASQTLLTEQKQMKLSDEKIMSALTDKLEADIVVVMELSRVRLDRFHSFNYEDTYIASDVLLKCYSYSAVSNKYLVIKASKTEIEDESIDTNAAAIFKKLTEDILVKLPYKRIPLNPLNS